jgi:hypothetical protein
MLTAGPALSLLMISVIAGIASLWLLWWQRFTTVRVTAA